VYLPPGTWGSSGDRDPDVLHAWFIAVVFLANWGVGSMGIAFEAARQEIYPFKEERIVVEGLCKYACMAGGSSGALPFFVLMTDARLQYRLALLCYIIPMCLISLEAVPVFREAQKAAEVGSWRGTLQLFREVLPCTRRPNVALRHLMGVMFWRGAYGASIATMLLYYVTYVLKLSSWERLFMGGAAALAGGASEIVTSLVFMRVFGEGDGRRDKAGSSDRRLLVVVVTFRVLNALSTVLLIGIVTPRLPLLFLWAITSRIFLAGFTFWLAPARCWVLDEEDVAVAGMEGSGREAKIFGALQCVQSFAGSAFSAVTFLGLALAGLKTSNCEAECETAGTPGGDCVEDCFRGVIDSQPESLRLYVRLVIGALAPLCELLIAFHAYKFPIKGVRLRRLYYNMAARHDAACPKDANDTELQAEAEAPPHSSASRIVLYVDSLTAPVGSKADVPNSPPWLDGLQNACERARNQGSLSVSLEVLPPPETAIEDSTILPSSSSSSGADGTQVRQLQVEPEVAPAFPWHSNEVEACAHHYDPVLPDLSSLPKVAASDRDAAVTESTTRVNSAAGRCCSTGTCGGTCSSA
jgi:hypothetical protein